MITHTRPPHHIVGASTHGPNNRALGTAISPSAARNLIGSAWMRASLALAFDPVNTTLIRIVRSTHPAVFMAAIIGHI